MFKGIFTQIGERKSLLKIYFKKTKIYLYKPKFLQTVELGDELRVAFMDRRK